MRVFSIKKKREGSAVYMWSCGKHCIDDPICKQLDGCVVSEEEMKHGKYVPGEWHAGCDCCWVKITGDQKPKLTGFPEIKGLSR